MLDELVEAVRTGSRARGSLVVGTTQHTGAGGSELTILNDTQP